MSDEKKKLRMLPEEVAARLGCSPVFVRMALREGRLPFGFAVKYPGSSRWTYVINRDKFEEFAAGK